jgi:anti-sigma regulatory factor (Ser/Thr protein kinase)
MPGSDSWRYEIREAHDLYVPRHEIRELCAGLGFTSAAGTELAIVVSELTSNILKYGARGVLRFEPVDDSERGRGVVILAHDIGPPFRNLELALRDGYDDRGPIDPVTLLERGGLGAGLGAVIRLTDSFEVQPTAPAGKEVRVVRYRKRPRRR